MSDNNPIWGANPERKIGCNCKYENRLNYTRIEYNQLWTFYQQLREENEQFEDENKRLKGACQAALDYLQKVPKFDWEEDLIKLITNALRLVDKKISELDREYVEYQQTILEDFGKK